MEHTVFVCESWIVDRVAMDSVSHHEEIEPANLVETMIKSKKTWDIVHNMIRKKSEEQDRT